MLTFMFSWLGSLLFFSLYFLLTILFVTLYVRKFCKKTYHWIKTGDSGWLHKPLEFVLMLACLFLCWPIILIGLILYFGLKLIFKAVILKPMLSIDKAIPKFTIVKDQED